MANFTVIVPAYNSERFLSECLDSLRAQTWQDWYCIVVNDGSTDHTQEIVQRYRAQDSRFSLLSQENQGLGEARNSGIRAAQTPWVALLDSDDFYFPEAIECFERTLAALPPQASVGVLAGYYSHTTDYKVTPSGFTLVDAFDSMYGLSWGPPICCSSAAVSLECFRDSGGFRSVPCEDRDFWFRAFARYQVCSIHETLAFYRRDQAGTMSDLLRAQGQIAMAQRKNIEFNRNQPVVLGRTNQKAAYYEGLYQIAWNLLTAVHFLSSRQFQQAAPHFLQAWNLSDSEQRESLIRNLLDMLPHPQNDRFQSNKNYGDMVFGLAGATPKGHPSVVARLRKSGTEAFFRAARELHARGAVAQAVIVASRALALYPNWWTFRAFLRLTVDLLRFPRGNSK